MIFGSPKNSFVSSPCSCTKRCGRVPRQVSRAMYNWHSQSRAQDVFTPELHAFLSLQPSQQPEGSNCRKWPQQTQQKSATASQKKLQ
jgi:hypothetical protein